MILSKFIYREIIIERTERRRLLRHDKIPETDRSIRQALAHVENRNIIAIAVAPAIIILHHRGKPDKHNHAHPKRLLEISLSLRALPPRNCLSNQKQDEQGQWKRHHINWIE